MSNVNNMRRMHFIFALWAGVLLKLISSSTCMDPKFDPSTRMRLVLVPADATVDSVIYRIRATDEEFDYPLTFELIGDTPSSTFQIISLPCTKYNSVCQANVVLKRRLEPGRYYDFEVSVRDTRGGTATQVSSITATNFTTPHDVIFPHKAGIIRVPENAKRGTELDYVIARKNPLFPKPVYLELWGSPLFAIRQKIVSPEMTEGTVFLLGPLDFEKQSMYHLTMLANDAYAEPGQDSRNIAGVEVVIVVEDVQDEPPVFTLAPPVTRLPAGLLPGDKILQVHAEDGDKGVPREIRYGLVSEGNPFTSFFEINETTGEIRLVKPVDEISALTHTGDPVLLTVIAEEVKVMRDAPPAMSSTVQLAFFLPERSNSPPYFDNDHYVARIDENAPSGTALVFPDPYVTRVSDDDAGKNGVFSLTLLNNNGTFEISPNVAERRANFVIRVRDNQLLDFEVRQMLDFQILAQELGPATNLSAIVNVTVYIDDVNDNAPIFDEPEYKVQLPENVTTGARVTQVHATDVDTGVGGRVRYTQILGFLNTSLNLDPMSGVVTISTNNHGFDREMMPEYHLYVVARDQDGMGNQAEVPLIIQLIDVNDETPTFEKPLYEFILTPDLRNFTAPAVVRAVDNDAEPPNNVVRYEITHGNSENRFTLNEYTGRLSLRTPLMEGDKPESGEDVYALTVRAFDLGVPVRWSTTTVRIYPPESRSRTVTFVVPGSSPDKQKVEETLITITGGRVIIQDMRPWTPGTPGTPMPGLSGGGGGSQEGFTSKEKTVVVATVLYDGNSIVDLTELQQKFAKNGTLQGIIIRDDAQANVYRAENKVLFWLLMLFALLLALGVLTLLLCCICSWCPLYTASRKKVIRVNSSGDDVSLVHREHAIGKTSKSVQVAEWMGGGRQAWSAQSRSSDPRTKPTHWKFAGRGHPDEKLGYDNRVNLDDEEPVTSKAIVDKQTVKIKDERSKTTTQKVTHEADYDDEDPEYHKIEPHNVDEDSMRRHEMERGSDIGYAQRGKGTRELFIKDGNAEILRLITRGKNDEENIYVNLPGRNPEAPQYIMVDNGGKEILMRRYIEEQANGKQIIREHYQVIPNATLLQPPDGQSIYQTIPVQQTAAPEEKKHISTVEINRPSVVEAETQMTAASPAHSVVQKELEDSLKQQNALLRQILLEKERLEERYNQQETALETQSLPCQSMAIATQTDVEAATQTDPVEKRRSRSENDDSLTEDEEYVRYSPPNSPNGVYWIKRKRHRMKTRYKDRPRLTDVSRKIRTPILEETEHDRRTPQKIVQKVVQKPVAKPRQSENRLKKDVLMEISDSLEDRQIRRGHGPKIYKKNIRYYIDSDGSEREIRQTFRRNYYSAESLDSTDDEETASRNVTPIPAIVKANRMFQKELEEYKKRNHKPPKRPAPKPPASPKLSSKFYTSEANLVERMKEEGMLDGPSGVARYMDWYYEKHRDKDVDERKGQKLKIKAAIRKKGNQSKLKRGTPARLSKSEEHLEKFKPEAAPRKSPPKPRLLKEDLDHARKVQQKKQTDSSHPLLQHSEHRFEHEYEAPKVPPPPTKLPHYLYPETPSFSRESSKRRSKPQQQPKVSPIKENEIKHSKSQVPLETLCVANLEDDHDSGIAMNSLMNSLGRHRNPIADKKSVFTIAYDEVRVKHIPSQESDSPPFSNRS